MPKEMKFLLAMEPPTATYQEKKINWKTKTIYQDPAAKEAREKLRAHLVQFIPDEPLTGPIAMTIIWGFHKGIGKHSFGDWHTNKPDIDNIQKALQDVMTELGFWKDDCCIAQLLSTKIWTWHPGISIVLRELDGQAVYENIG